MSDRACKSDSHRGFEGACPGVALPSSNPEGTTEGGVPVLGATENSATIIARGRAIKRVNAWTAVFCGGLPALALGILFHTGLQKFLASFVVGLLWASLFEYAYRRFLLHLPGTFFARRHPNTTLRWGRRLKPSTSISAARRFGSSSFLRLTAYQ